MNGLWYGRLTPEQARNQAVEWEFPPEVINEMISEFLKQRSRRRTGVSNQLDVQPQNEALLLLESAEGATVTPLSYSTGAGGSQWTSNRWRYLPPGQWVIEPVARAVVSLPAALGEVINFPLR